MKNVLFTVVVCVCVLLAGTAMADAYGWGGHGGRRGGMGGCGGGGMGYDSGSYGNRGHRGGPCFAAIGDVDIPREIIDKRTEAEKIAIDLRAELSKRPVNRARALDLYKKHQALHLAVSDWCFQQRLSAIR